MIELFKMALAKPLHCIVVTLCLVSMTLSTEVFQVKQAIAVINEQQKFDSYINDKVLNMSDALIRIDENVKFMKKNQILASRMAGSPYPEIIIENLYNEN